MTRRTDANSNVDGPETPRRGRPRSIEADQAILTATIDLASEVGITGMSMDDVAQRAGVSKATIYRRWCSKEALVLDALRSATLPFDDVDTGTLSGDLDLYVGELDPPFRNNGPMNDVLPHLIEVSCHDETIRSSLDDYIRVRRVPLRTILTRAIERGELPSEHRHRRHDRHADRGVRLPAAAQPRHDRRRLRSAAQGDRLPAVRLTGSIKRASPSAGAPLIAAALAPANRRATSRWRAARLPSGRAVVEQRRHDLDGTVGVFDDFDRAHLRRPVDDRSRSRSPRSHRRHPAAARCGGCGGGRPATRSRTGGGARRRAAHLRGGGRRRPPRTLSSDAEPWWLAMIAYLPGSASTSARRSSSHAS